MDSVIEGENGHDFVIVGGGIGGLATALALHRKGFKDVVVYERSKRLRAEGPGLVIFSNGWRALDQLGVGDQLREKAILLQGAEDVYVDQGKSQNLSSFDRSGEARCLKRSDLINVLANALPRGTIRFGCNAIAVKTNSQNMSPILQLGDDKAIPAKILIGCDGSNSKVADFLGLKLISSFKTFGAVRGLTKYPNKHLLPPTFVHMRRDKNLVGRIPINDKLVFWYVELSPPGGQFPNDPELIRKATLGMVKGFPFEVVEMIEKSDLASLSFTDIRYRHPWEIVAGNFRRGSVTVLGDAMHAMPPFRGQGASAALEDAVVLARNLGQRICSLDQFEGRRNIIDCQKIRAALDGYVKERRMRILHLSLQTYLIGVILDKPSLIVKFIAIMILVIVFRDETRHVKYDCGKL
ncbi:OLC1v1015803C1 [Oldenlandia corymbosa var. corymbosa]|uniref:OLC1v1015803C1 n=1 Tax=Oldenlandia corymbosa var. corymbosa TaxID=529605 RepID=A0AAV1E6Z9_OLDCO|nr:OLC1v1015803C1 [Oldenlandia corymbosa var. corymbosa]